MILKKIKEKLEEIDSKVFYGIVDNSVRNTAWDYIVFDRKRMKPSPNRTGYSYVYSVHIVRENFIPEDLDIEVIDKVLEIDGIRLADTDCEYTYVEKPNTNIVVEMLTIDFVRAKKKA